MPNSSNCERHKWGDPIAYVEDTPSGCQETERVCERCGVVKVTIHIPHETPLRAWRRAGETLPIEATPPCRPGQPVAIETGA